MNFHVLKITWLYGTAHENATSTTIMSLNAISKASLPEKV